MERRQFIQNTALTIGALTLGQQKILSALVEDPWKITMLRNDVGIFEERGGTIAFLLNKKGIAVVDSQFPDQSNHLITELKKKSEVLLVDKKNIEGQLGEIKCVNNEIWKTLKDHLK